jgi:hypothetical protein
MKTLTLALAAGAAALFATAATAAPLSIGPVASDSNIQSVRMICNEDGRCWREREERRVIIREPRESYGYARREGYVERRTYESREPGIGIRAPGVSIGIGGDRY